MKKAILSVLGVLSILYGILVLQVGSGTGFWIIWEVIGVFFLFWTFLVHTDFFTTRRKMKVIFHTMMGVGIAVVVILCGMIMGDFSAKGSQNLDYIIVLGAQVREDGPSVVLKYRLDAAVDYLNGNPDTICIVSGGQGTNEPFSEAEGMAEYLLDKGIDEHRIVLEDKSTSTVENIQNSKILMEESYNGVGIVTNNFHVFRAVQIAKVQGLEGGLVIDGVAPGWVPMEEFQKKGLMRIVHTGLLTIGKSSVLFSQTKVPNAFLCKNCNKIVGVFDITNNIDD